MLGAFPLLLIPIVLYNVIAFGGSALEGPETVVKRLNEAIIIVPMHSGMDWTISAADLLIVMGLALLFVELLKSTSSHKVAIINHSFSMLLFIACLVEFLLFEAFATSVFFILMMMTLLDVLAGFIVTILAARRDLNVG